MLATLIIAVGLFSILPQTLIWNYLADNGQEFLSKNMVSDNDSTRGFLGRAREIYDTGKPSMELSLETQGIMLFPLLPYYIAAALLKIFKGNANTSYLALSFLFSGIMFLTTMLAGRKLVKTNWLGSLFMASVATLSPTMLYLPKAFFSLSNFKNIILTSFYPGVQTLMDRSFLSKLEDPLIVTPFFILAITALYLFWNSPKKSTALVAGALTGLMFNVYFFNWVYLVIISGILFVYIIIKRKENLYKLKLYPLFTLALLILAMPFVTNYLEFQKLPAHEEYLPRYAEMEYGRFFRLELSHSRAGISIIPDYIFYIFLGALVILTFKKNRDKMIFYLAAITSMFLVWNVQLVTGYVPESFHWHAVISIIIFIILFDLGQFYAKTIFKKVKIKPATYASILLIILIMLMVTKKSVNSGFFINPPDSFSKKYAFESDLISSWNWINKKLPPESHIASPSVNTTIYLNDYTAARPYLPIYILTLGSTQELEKRFVYVNQLFNIPTPIFRGRAEQNQDIYKADIEGIMNSVYGNTYRNLYYNSSNPGVVFENKPPPEKAEMLFNLYSQKKPLWSDLKANYVYLGPFEKELGANVNLSEYKELKLVYKNKIVEIYKINKKNNL